VVLLSTSEIVFQGEGPPISRCDTGTMANCERTFIAIKPDGVQRGLVGEIIKRFEQKGFRLVGLKFMQESAEKEIGLWFHPEELVDYMSCAQNWIYE
uniref:nucleoside-diphosphate kinase n=1 Tax=Colobus angolensis palliatus TaxID=336983 RepID=A0A2K5HZX2_COLAP